MTATRDRYADLQQGAGTYTVDLANPIVGFTISDTGSANASAFIGYDAPGQGGGSDEVVVAQIGTQLFLQFSGDARANNASGTMQTSFPGGAANGQAFVAGEVFNAATAGFPSMQISSAAIGVSSNVLQTGEVVDFNLYQSDPGGTLGLPASTFATNMFMTFDQVLNG